MSLESEVYIPTLRELIEKYKEIAYIEQSRNGKPQNTTIRNCITGTKAIISFLDNNHPREDNISWLDAKYNELTRKVLTKFVDDCQIQKKKRKISIQSQLLQLRGITAKWSLSYYDDMGWDITPLNIPRILKEPKRYTRPPKHILKRVSNWYNALEKLPDKRYYVFVTMMLQFGMRNGDVCRLTRSNFIEDEGQMFLNYKPHKTALSSARVIKWPIHISIWEKLDRYIDEIQEFCSIFKNEQNDCDDAVEELIIPDGNLIMDHLNKQINNLKLFDELNTEKSLYELRKICVDHIYQNYGSEMASSISGDDIKTVMKYYADPSQVRINGGIVISNMF